MSFHRPLYVVTLQASHEPRRAFKPFLSCMWNDGGSLKGHALAVAAPLLSTKTPFFNLRLPIKSR